MSKTKKVIIAALVIVVGLPLAFILIAFSCFWFMDKTNSTVVSSDLTRRYLLDVPKS
jgi:hypothetical protein